MLTIVSMRRIPLAVASCGLLLVAWGFSAAWGSAAEADEWIAFCSGPAAKDELIPLPGGGYAAIDSGYTIPGTPLGNCDIHIIRPDGSDQRNLTNTPGIDERNPSWAPDGTKIAFSKFNGIWVMNADGSNQICLSQRGDDAIWSPGGRRIAFDSERDGNREIYVMNADGTDQTRLTNNAAADMHPTWSPDEARIAFASKRDGNWEIYVMNADGSSQSRVTNDPADDGQPNWSPDGRSIAFASSRSGHYDIYVMDPSGSGSARITWDSHDLDWEPAWSPDGTMIAFQKYGSIHMIDARGGWFRRVSATSTPDAAPSWVRVSSHGRSQTTPGQSQLHPSSP